MPTGYEILRAVGDGELATLVADTQSTATAHTDATATAAGETYAYRVKAIRGEDRSQASGQAQVQLPHDAVDLAPSNLTAEKVDGGINLSWTAPAEDAGGCPNWMKVPALAMRLRHLLSDMRVRPRSVWRSRRCGYGY